MDAQHAATYFGVLVDIQSVLQKTPAAVYDLSARFHSQRLLLAGKLVRLDLLILRSHPHELAIGFGSLLLVYDSVMKYTGDFGGITLRRVCGG